MNSSVASAVASPSRYAPLRIGVHALVGTAVALVSPFTALAWPFALLVGMVIGASDARRMRGEHEGAAETAAAVLIGAIGTLAMLFFGAIVGGIVAIAVVALASFSERAAAHAAPVDRGVARILLFVVPAAAWLVVFPLLGLSVDLRIGG